MPFFPEHFTGAVQSYKHCEVSNINVLRQCRCHVSTGSLWELYEAHSVHVGKDFFHVWLCLLASTPQSECNSVVQMSEETALVIQKESGGMNMTEKFSYAHEHVGWWLHCRWTNGRTDQLMQFHRMLKTKAWNLHYQLRGWQSIMFLLTIG